MAEVRMGIILKTVSIFGMMVWWLAFPLCFIVYNIEGISFGIKEDWDTYWDMLVRNFG